MVGKKKSPPTPPQAPCRTLSPGHAGVELLMPRLDSALLWRRELVLHKVWITLRSLHSPDTTVGIAQPDGTLVTGNAAEWGGALRRPTFFSEHEIWVLTRGYVACLVESALARVDADRNSTGRI